MKIQFDHFRKKDVIGKRDDIIEIGFFFVLGIYNAMGPGQPIDDKARERIQAVRKATNIKVLVSLSCTMCPDTVVAAQHIAAKKQKRHGGDIRYSPFRRNKEAI